ncbi:MAG: DUF4347 domain-containing protein [Timaviella obliquedivisa GSE-PSE-MK23-08B]|jgi:plastocyanin|nr:DUF4347 domain-containing protein [Timaviella obliquedivisa GSE-PSE-MK23-08B]
MSAIAPVKSLVFIDAAVVDYQSLIDGLVPGTEAIVLDPAQDGVEQMTATLANRSDIQSVHIVSHGSSGSLQLGAATLNGESIDRYQAQLQGWRSALTEDADILLYGCNVAAGDTGAAFIQQVRQLTRAEIAASAQPTGNPALGGDWELEITTKSMLMPQAFLPEVLEAYPFVLAPPELSGNDRAAILGAPGDPAWLTDVVNKVQATGLFSLVDSFKVGGTGAVTPTLAQLQNYGSILVFSDTGFQNATLLGDTLANYVDSGRGVVVSTFALGGGATLGGRWNTGGYSPVVIGGSSTGTATLGTIFNPAHPIVQGVSSFSGGTSSYRATGTANPSATVVANWSDNRLLAVDLQTFNGGIVGLNFYPPSSTVRGDFWNAATQGALLMGNALEYIGGSAVRSTATEDAVSYNINLLANATDPDGDPLNVSNLILASGNATGVTVIGNDLSVSPSAYNFLSSGQSEIINYSYNIIDGNGGSIAQTAKITITGLNDAPVLTGSATLTAIDEDVLDVANTGTKVSALINGLITDVDGDPKAIAITGVDNTKGVWQYSTDGGAIWTNFSATPSDGTATVLGATSFYQASLGTAPTAQGQLSFTNLNPVTPAQLGTQTFDSSGTILNTDVDSNIYAGYSNFSGATPVNPPLPKLDNVEGYSVSFNLQLLTESHTNSNRAGFSIIVVSNDKTKAIELGFQDGNIFAQKDAGFTADESVTFNTKQSIDYRLEVLGNSYTLFANNAPILTGALRDYSAFSGAIDPYETPNFIFLGDDSTSAQGSFNLSQVVVQTDNRVRFVPNANENGNSTINFRAWDTTDGASAGAIVDASVNGGINAYSAVAETATIAVTAVNDAPTISGTPAVTIAEDSLYSFIPSAIDVDLGDSLTFSITNQPTWASFNSATGELSGTPINGDVGTTTGIIISVSDGIAPPVDLPAFDLAVTNTNDAPTISGTPAVTIAEDSPYSFIPTAIDVDLGDTLTFSIVNKPSWATFNPATGELSGTPINGDVGTTNGIIISVSDGIAAPVDLPAFNLAVTNTNDAPTISGTPAVTIAEDSSYSFIPTAIDIDSGDTLTFSIVNKPSWATFNPATGELSGTPINGDVGTTNGIIISVSDGIAAPVDLPAFNLAVTNTNDAPTISGTPAVTIAEDSPYSFIPTATDVDLGDTLAFSIVNKPTWATFNSTTGELSGTPVNGNVGTTTGIIISVSDGTTTVALSPFDLGVTNVNDAPTVTTAIVDQAATEDTLFTFAVPPNSFTDIDAGDTLTYTATQSDNAPLPLWLTFNATNQTFSGTPANGDIGNFDIKVTAKDSANATVEDIFSLTVNSVNDAPTLDNPIADQPATEDTLFTFAVPTNTFSDVDTGDILTYTATQADDTPLPSWLTFNATTQTFSGTPLNAQVGSLNVKVKATDTGLLTAEDSFTMTIANTNDTPTVTNAIADQSATEDIPFTFTLPTNTFTDVDAGDSLTYTATLANSSPLPTWLAFNPISRTFSGTPRNANVGNLDLKVKVTDKAGAIAEDIFVVKVANVNQPPGVGTPITPVPQQVTATQAFTLKIPTGAFTDPDAGDSLTFSASLESGAPLPPWLVFDAKAASFSGIPDFPSVGNLSLKVNATDAQGSRTSQLVRFTIANPTGITGISTALIDFSGGKKGVTRKAKKGQLLRGTHRSDILRGTKGNDRINSGRRSDSHGKDKLYGFNGNDRLKAGGGNDYVDGGQGNDFLKGGRGRDLLLGGEGNDRILGGDGDDILVGGSGADILAGGNGRDIFAFANINEGKDAIVDFSPTEDLIDLRSLFAQPQFAGATPYVRYLKYVQMTQVGTSTEIKIDADGSGVGNTFTTLATLNNIGIGAMGSRNFVIS